MNVSLEFVYLNVYLFYDQEYNCEKVWNGTKLSFFGGTVHNIYTCYKGIGAKVMYGISEVMAKHQITYCV
jgi:hypothetical protein